MDTHQEKRRDKRDLFTVTVEYSYPAAAEGENPRNSGAAITSNLSDHGLGFYTNHSLDQGQALTLFSRHLAKQPLPAEVRWCQQVSDNIFRVGLMFT
jgi:hypothetical protein